MTDILSNILLLFVVLGTTFCVWLLTEDDSGNASRYYADHRSDGDE